MSYSRNIIVNFNVSVDANGQINVLGVSEEAVSNVVVAETTIAATTLYDTSSNNLIRFYEPSDNRGVIYGEHGYNHTGRAAAFANALNTTLNGTLDASAATPFSNALYLGNSAYYRYSSVGEMALALAAHQVFGHAAATAAITNDTAFVSRMNAHVTATTANVVVESSGDYAANAVDASANIALRIVQKLLHTCGSGESGNYTHIARVVVGQDAARAKDEDNNDLVPDNRYGLRFYAGDTIYVTLVLKGVDVTVGPNAGAQLAGQAAGDASGQGLGTDSDVTYVIKLTLA